jgi:tartrate dehydratase alpha subunit/fumarate hydratase class I-like protein
MLADFIRETSSSIPEDVENALKKAMRKEEKGSSAKVVIETILSNIKLAREKGTPLCQDTGTLTFFVSDRYVLKVGITAAESSSRCNGLIERSMYMVGLGMNQFRKSVYVCTQ